MNRSELATDDVAAVYEDLHATYEWMWDQYGHRSIHLGYYDEDADEPEAAAENAIRVLADAAGIDPDDRVLNIGCGAGEDATWVARERGASVVGVNISESQLALARDDARERGLDDRIDYRRDDFHELATVDDDSVDVVWGLEALSHANDDRRVLDQARRVLVDDGRLAIAGLFRRSGGEDGGVDEGGNGGLSESDERRLRRAHDGLGVRFDPIADLEAAATDLGFRNVTVRDATDAIRPSVKNRYRFSLLAYPASRLLRPLGFLTDSHVAMYRSSYHVHKLVQSDALGYYVVTADR